MMTYQEKTFLSLLGKFEKEYLEIAQKKKMKKINGEMHSLQSIREKIYFQCR